MVAVKNLELYFQHAPVANLATLATIDTTGIVDGEYIVVSSAGIYKLQKPAVLTPDGRDVILGSGGGVWVRQSLPALVTNTNGAIDISVGGTGKTTPQDAINELVGAPTAARTFLRSDGVNVSMAAIEAGDLPTTLTQNTTGTSSNVTGTILFSNGGTGQTSQQASLDALVGSVVDGHYLQGDGVNAVMAGIDAADVPTLNQDTTGTAQYATNVAGGIANEIPFQTAADTTSFITPAASSVLITDGSSVPSLGSTLPSTVQSNITTVGAITSGTWHGDIIGPTYGGTGVDNGVNTITIGGNITTDAAFNLNGIYSTDITVTGITSVTLPVSGTLATTSDIPSFPLAPNLGGTGIDNAAKTITLGGSISTGGALTLSGAYDTTFTVTGVTSLTLPTSGTLINDTELASQLTGYETVFNGIEDASLFTLGYDASTRQFSITYASGAAYTVGGVRYTTTPGTVYTTAHSTTSQQYYCYYNSSGVLTVSSTAWDLLTTAPIALVYYNNSNAGGAAAGILQYELHAGNKGMSNATHLYLHNIMGTQLLNGCLASGYTLDAPGPTNVNWTTSAGNVADEDIQWPVASQPLGGANTYRILYLTGPEGSPVWNWVDVAQYGIYHDGTDIYYNQNNGGTYQLTPITTNNTFVNYYILATTSNSYPHVIAVMGQNTYATEVEADAATFADDCPNFGLFTSEAVVLYQVIYRRAAAQGNPGNVDIKQFEQVIQSLVTSGVGGTIDASSVTVSTAGFVNFFTATDGNVQTCLNTLDANVPFSLTHGGTGTSLTASNGGILYSTASTAAILPGTATANQIIVSGSSSAPSWSTATYPATTTANQLLYSSAANTIGGLTTANNGVLVTDGSGVPSIGSTLPTAVQGNITSLGTIASGAWNGDIIGPTYGGTGVNNGTNTITLGGNVSTGGAFTLNGAFDSTFNITAATNVTFPTSGTLATTSGLPTIPLPLSDGGTNANLSASNGGIVYSTDTALSILPGTATANQIIVSGSSSAPSWSTATYPSTTTANQLLYSSATNTVGGLTTANNGVLITSAAGIPSISSTLPSAVQGNITSTGTIASGTWEGTAVDMAHGGTGANLTPTANTICYSTGSALDLSYNAIKNSQLLSSNLAGKPTWTQSSYPSITAQYDILYAENANDIGRIATATGSVLVTAFDGSPSWLANASVGGRAKYLSSIGTGNPVWSNVTYPITTTTNRMLYSSAANTVSEIPTANGAILKTNILGVPGYTPTMTNGTIIIGYNGGSPQVGSLSSASGGLSIIPGAGTLAVNIDKGGYYVTAACVYEATTQNVRKSWNVSSVTYTSTGTFTINFTTSFADAYYAPATSCYASATYNWIVTTTGSTTSTLGIATTSSDFLTNNPLVGVVISNGASFS